MTIAQFLVKEGLLERDRVAELVRIESETGQTLDRLILKKGYLSEEDTLRAFGKALGIPYLPEISREAVAESFLARVPVQFARNYNLIGIGAGNGICRVACCTPLDLHPLDELSLMLDCEVEPVLAPRVEITALIDRAYKKRQDAVEDALEGVEDEDLISLTSQIDASEDLLDMANKGPIVKLVNMILFQALKMRASDVHIQPYEDKLQIRYRIDGILYDMESPPKKFQDAILSRIKVMGRMDIAERRLPQDGRTTTRFGNNEVDIRISSVPTSSGERIVMRLLDKGARLYDLEEIGLTPENSRAFLHAIESSHGIIFVTGPTGSGKTTTLYAAIKRLNSTEKNIITIEDPIEYHLEGVSQIQVNVKKGLSFAAGLRSLLRQDPDVMMVGEVRDQETARIAIQSALTGHLVFSTLHTNDAAGAISRLLDIGIEPYLVASSLVLVMAQRLVRLICPDCREQYRPAGNDLKRMQLLGLSPDRLIDGKLTRGRGCDHCFNGFMNRTGIYEILPIDEVVRAQVMDRLGAATIKKVAVDRGHRTLRMDGVDKVIRGVTTVDEVLRVTQMDVL
ncbi:MAG: type II secretion system ATPase GspE [Planctomycetes bacterium]|nr:type II secretion system ATPase GspE [Planctomycetota bacterium]